MYFKMIHDTHKEINELHSYGRAKDCLSKHNAKKNAFDKSTNIVKKKISKVKDKIKGVTPNNIFAETAPILKSASEVRIFSSILLVILFLDYN